VISTPVHRRDFLVVPCNFLAQCPADPLQRPAFELIAQPVGIGDRPAVVTHHDPLDSHLPRILIDLDLHHHCRIAVVSLIRHARHPPATHHAGALPPGIRRRPRIPLRRLRRRLHHLAQPWIAQMPHPVFPWIGLHLRRQFIHKRLMRERVLQARRRPQRPRPERRHDVMHQHPLACYRTRILTRSPNLSGHIRRHPVAVVIEPGRCRRRSSRYKRIRREAEQHPCDDIPRRPCARPVSQPRRPCLVVPRHDVARCIQPRAFIHQKRIPVVLPRHLIFAAQLDTNRFSHCLRQHRGVIGHRIRTVQSITSRPAPEDHPDVIRLDSQHHGTSRLLIPNRLRRRPDGRRVAPHIGHGT